jgi:hypothetical protein
VTLIEGCCRYPSPVFGCTPGDSLRYLGRSSETGWMEGNHLQR